MKRIASERSILSLSRATGFWPACVLQFATSEVPSPLFHQKYPLSPFSESSYTFWVGSMRTAAPMASWFAKRLLMCMPFPLRLISRCSSKSLGLRFSDRVWRLNSEVLRVPSWLVTPRETRQGIENTLPPPTLPETATLPSMLLPSWKISLCQSVLASPRAWYASPSVPPVYHAMRSRSSSPVSTSTYLAFWETEAVTSALTWMPLPAAPFLVVIMMTPLDALEP